MIITSDRFWRGYSWSDYLGRIKRNRELFQKSYDSVEMTDAEVEWLRHYEHTTYILGIGEDWCPDVFGNLPVMARMVSYNPEKLTLRIFPRDELVQFTINSVTNVLIARIGWHEKSSSHCLGCRYT